MFLRRSGLFCILILTGCTTYNGTPPEVIDRNKLPSTTDGRIPSPPPIGAVPTPSTVDMQVALPQTQVAVASIAIPPAALGLAKQAEEKEREGDLTSAGALLERALHIAPNSAEIYYRLARVREAQGQHDQAVQFARRGLAQDADSELQAKLQTLIVGN